MTGYGWTTYDIRKGGTHVVNDTVNKIDLIVHFAKFTFNDHDDGWTLTVKGLPRSNARGDLKTTVVPYFGIEDPGSITTCAKAHNTGASSSDVVCEGSISGLGHYGIQISDHGATDGFLQSTSVSSLTVPVDTIWQAKSIFLNQLKSSGSLAGVIADNPGEGNLHFVQKAFGGEFGFDILFCPDSITKANTSRLSTEGMRDVISTFNTRFQSVFKPQAPFQDGQYVEFSQSLISNLLGGIGYFHGTSKVDVSSASEYDGKDEDFENEVAESKLRAAVEDKGPYQLFSAVPSRPFFPRGFLWDEGFHLLIIHEWDMDVALEIVSSWFDLMNQDGWIAREQILGPEARSKVPREFQMQYPHYANPPTLFLVLQAFVEKLNGESSYLGAASHYLSDPASGKAFLRVIYEKMKTNFEWFRRTQVGNLTNYQLPERGYNHGYRWRGRTTQHILPSGLDDYPRVQPPHPEELHVDALSWVGSMAVVLRKISSFLDNKQDHELFSKHEMDIIRSLDNIHWSEQHQAYCDTTITNENQVNWVCHKGYISLFPFLVGLMGANHNHLEAVLNLMHSPDELWSPFGLRSLSLKDKYYGTAENYWRSPIWVNINYMALKRLLVSTLQEQ